MIVGRSTLDHVIELLRPHKVIALDTETTGLRPYHGDRMFSLILAMKATDGTVVPFYFNFWPSYPGVALEHVLTRDHLLKLKILFDDADKKWYIHKFNFDMHVLGVEGLEIAGEVFCTLTQGRVEYNEHLKYNLDASLARIGLKKHDTVEEWIKENKAFEVVDIPGKKQQKKNKFFYKVPYDIIVPYGCADASGGFSLGEHLESSISAQASQFPPGVPTLLSAAKIECRLAKTVYRMEKRGVKIDRAYVSRALKYEADRLEKATQSFRKEANRDYSASSKLFASLFESEKDKWTFTEKGNPSFESDTLKTFLNPAAKLILNLRDAKSKLDFYNGFLWHADSDDVIHPQFHPGGARTFRFSSSEPNLQNLTSEDATYCRTCKEWHEEFVDICPECQGTDIEHPEFMVRRAFVPRPGFIFIMPDYDQMEYKMILDYSKHMMISHFRKKRQAWDEDYFEVANKVRDGFDVHKATATLMGVPRKYAKTLNFLLLYGGGVGKLAEALGVTYEEAERLRRKYFLALPYVNFYIHETMGVVKSRGWIRNWAGYKYNFPNRNFAYTAPNTLIQGGCAAVMKTAMNEIDEILMPYKSKLVLTVHDELPTEVHESEIHVVPKLIKDAMERVYPYKYIPLTAGMEWSDKSLADKKKGFPT